VTTATNQNFSMNKINRKSFSFCFENLPVDNKQIKTRNAKTARTTTIIGIPAGDGSKYKRTR